MEPVPYASSMLLPNGKNAIVDIRKLRDYCLNPDSPRGKHKATVFVSALGVTSREAESLRTKLFEIAQSHEADMGELDLFGQRYTIDFEMETDVGKAVIRTGWIVLHGESAPRFLTCYVKKRK
jgi:hypothetical protein